MRILITDFFGIMAGSSYSAVYLAEALQEQGNEVTIACRVNSFLEELSTCRGISCVSFARTGKFNLSAASMLASFVRDSQVEVVLSQASPDRYLTIFARWFFGMKSILIHTRRQKPVGAYRLKSWFYTKGTDRMVAVGNTVKQVLISSGIPENQLLVINNGFPTAKQVNPSAETVEDLRSRYNLSKGDFVIGCVSRIKKQDQIIKAISLIEKPLTLILVGIENEYPDLQDLIKEIPSGHSVYFTGEIPNEEVLIHYFLFDLKILASDMEGFSQAIMEAMAAEVPVIATDAAGNPDLIDHGINGFLFQDGDISYLTKLISDIMEEKIELSPILERAKLTVKENNMEKVADGYLRLIQSIC